MELSVCAIGNRRSPKLTDYASSYVEEDPNCRDGDEEMGASEEDDDDFELVHSSGAGSEEDYFDTVVSCMQDIMMESTFEEQISCFCRQHCGAFEDTDDNNLETFVIYQRYVELVESLLETMVQERMADFCMQQFLEMLSRCPPHCLHGDLFDMLLAVTDFATFKAHMLSFKSESDVVDLVPTVSGLVAPAMLPEAT